MANSANSKPIECWEPIPGWEGIYSVSNLGRVRSETRRRVRRDGSVVVYPTLILKTYNKNGYPAINLRDGERRERAYVHRLVCRTFHGQAPEGCEVAHNDGNRLNASAENLRWATRSENLSDMIVHGTRRHRDNYRHAKIRSADLSDIIRRFDCGERNCDIMRDYPIARPYVSTLRRMHRPDTIRQAKTCK